MPEAKKLQVVRKHKQKEGRRQIEDGTSP